MSTFSSVKVFATSGSKNLASNVCQSLSLRLPEHFQNINLSRSTVDRFSNENIQVQVEDVRDCFVVVIHTQAPPVSDGLIELFALLDAINNAKPADILLVFPYMPYSRSDRKNQPRISTMGCCLPRILNTSFGIKRVILLDPHDSHIKHYFYPAADEVSAMYLLVDYLDKKVFNTIAKKDSIVVFSDSGSAKKYGKMAYLLGLPAAYVDKDRPDNKEGVQTNKLVGEVSGKFCFLLDDEILTGGTAIEDAKTLKENGANHIYMLAVHPVLAKIGMSRTDVVKRLENSFIEKFILSDSIPLDVASPKFVILSSASLLAESISRTILGQPLTELHQLKNVNLYPSPF